jgi:hypothetical protein
LKKRYVKKALDSRYILLQKNRFSKFKSRAIVRKIKKNIASRKFKGRETDLENYMINKTRINNFIKSLLFLKFKNNKYKKPIYSFKKLLFRN